MNSLLLKVVGLLVWGVALFSVLQLGQVTEHSGHTHSICGPWGCGPPIAALVGWHGFWLVLVAPLAGALLRSWPARRLRAVGLLLLAVGIFTLVGIAIWEATTWLPPRPGDQRIYFVQRVLFSVVTLTDVPVISITTAGIAMCLAALVKQAAYSGSNSFGEVSAKRLREAHENAEQFDAIEVEPSRARM